MEETLEGLLGSLEGMRVTSEDVMERLIVLFNETGAELAKEKFASSIERMKALEWARKAASDNLYHLLQVVRLS